MAAPDHRLVRVKEGAWIAGVLSGVARWLGWDPTAVRVAFVLCSILSTAIPGLLVYLVLWAIMPREPGWT